MTKPTPDISGLDQLSPEFIMKNTLPGLYARRDEIDSSIMFYERIVGRLSSETIDLRENETPETDAQFDMLNRVHERSLTALREGDTQTWEEQQALYVIISDATRVQ